MPPQRRTAWHPLFVRTLCRALPQPYFAISAEVPLNQEPLRIDTIVVRKCDPPAGFVPEILDGIYPYLGQHTLISMKGATDVFDWPDVIQLTSVYAGLYCIEQQLEERSLVRLMAVTPHLTRRCLTQLRHRGGVLQPLAEGITEVRGLPHLLYLVETDKVSDHILHLFSREFLRHPGGLLELLTEAERGMLMQLLKDIRQLDSALSQQQYPDYEEVTMSLEQFMEEMVQYLPAEKRLKGLAAEERLKGLAAEERLKGLTPEDIIKSLPEEVLALLKARDPGKLT